MRVQDQVVVGPVVVVDAVEALEVKGVGLIPLRSLKRGARPPLDPYAVAALLEGCC